MVVEPPQRLILPDQSFGNAIPARMTPG